jgi:hypothetical protein
MAGSQREVGFDVARWGRAVSGAWAPIVSGLAALVVYLVTLAPGVYGYDSAELATGAYTLGIVHPTGYPLYLLATRLIMFLPAGSIAFRANLASAAFGAGAVFLLASLAKRITGSNLASLFGGLVLAFGITFWRLSVVAEVYTLHVFLLALALVLAQKAVATRGQVWLFAMALTYGLSLSNHVSGALYAPVFILVVTRVLPRRQWLTHGPLIAATAAAGLIPYIYLPLRAAAQPELDYVRDYYGVNLGTLGGLFWMVSGQAYRFFAFSYSAGDYLREVGAFGGFLWRNFTGVGIVLGAVGCVVLSRRKGVVPIGLGWVFVSTVLFFSGYGVSDKNTMFLPAYLVWAVWISVGVLASLEWASKPGRAWRPAPRIAKALVGTVAVALVTTTVGLNWRQADMSHSTEVEALARRTLAAVEPDAVVLGSWSTAVVLEYLQQVEGLRPDVTVFNTSRFEVAEYYRLWKAEVPYEQAVEEIFAIERAFVRMVYDKRPVYGIGYDRGLARDYEYRPVGTLFRLVARGGTGES